MSEQKHTPTVPAASNQQEMPLLEPKLYPPRLPTLLVERADVLEKLHTLEEQRLTLLCAPAGFGKTTAIRQWMESKDREKNVLPVAWVALENSLLWLCECLYYTCVS